MITVNGKKTEIPENLTVDELLLREGFRAERVVVEVNMKIVPRGGYKAARLRDGDSIEILQFVGGG